MKNIFMYVPIDLKPNWVLTILKELKPKTKMPQNVLF